MFIYLLPCTCKKQTMKNQCQFEESDNLVVLRELTPKLQDFSQIIRNADTPEIKEFNLDIGTSYMVGLYNSPEMAVARVYSAAGTEFPPHKHNEWELILVYQGEIHLKTDNKVIKLKEKGFYYIEPNVSHSAYYPVDSWVLCVTMPASADFPIGG